MGWNVKYGTPFSNILATPATGSLVLTGANPSIGQVYIQPGTGSLSLSGQQAQSSLFQITNLSLPAATVGSEYQTSASPQLTSSGGVGSVSYFCQRAYPNDGQWLYCLPNGQLHGIPQATDTLTAVFYAVDSVGNVTAPATFSIPVNVSGVLAVVTGTALSQGQNTGILANQIILSGGVPPYSHNITGLSEPYFANERGWVIGAPNGSASLSLSDTITDAAGTSVTHSFTMTVATGYTIGVLDNITNVVRFPQAMVRVPFAYQVPLYGASSGWSVSITSGSLPAGLAMSSGGNITGTPTQAGAYSFTLQATNGANTTPFTTINMVVTPETIGLRPSYNTGAGFFVLNGKLYTPAGHLFRGRGFNRNHFDATFSGGSSTGANLVRHVWGNQYGETPSNFATTVSGVYSGNGIVPILTNFTVITTFNGSIDVTGTVLTVSAFTGSVGINNAGIIVYGNNNSGGNGSVSLSGVSSGYITGQLTGTSGGVGTYSIVGGTANASGAMTLTTNNTSSNPDPNCVIGCANELAYALNNGVLSVQNGIMINLANEWGNAGASWVSAYESAIPIIRNTGYKGPIVIDTPNEGEDSTIFTNGDAASVVAADTCKNIVFSNHWYNTTNIVMTISSVTTGTTTTFYSNSTASANPFTYPQVPNFNGSICIQNVAGMPQLNGGPYTLQSTGGSAGNWYYTVALDSSSFTGTPSGGQIIDYFHYNVRAQTAAAAIANGFCVIVGEFGPSGLNNTLCGLGDIISACEAEELSYGFWAWDDHYASPAWNGTFCMTWPNSTYTYGQYVPSDPGNSLTINGLEIIGHPKYGMLSMSSNGQIDYSMNTTIAPATAALQLTGAAPQ